MKIVVFALTLLISFSSLSQDCPKFTIHSPATVTAGEDLSFIVNMEGASDGLTYNWSISAGTITSGQGTSQITVDTKELGGMTTTATVEVGGLPSNCSGVVSSTVQIMSPSEKVISAKFTTLAALSAAVKQFITKTDIKNPESRNTAFVYVYKGATTTASQLKQINATITTAFEKNGVPSYQYMIKDGGKKKLALVEMYKVPEGAEEPKPSN